MRVLMMGYGKVGLHLIPLLAAEGHHIAMIDSDRERLETVTKQENVEGFFASEHLMDTLRQAGVANADVFLALSENDNRNAMAAQVAQHVFHVPSVICRIDDPERQQVYQQLGMRVVCPTTSLVEAIHTAIKG